MTIRVPQDPNNWTAKHARKAVEHAWKLFYDYERKVDFDWPEAQINELYRPYMNAAEQAKLIAKHVMYYEDEARRLP